MLKATFQRTAALLLILIASAAVSLYAAREQGEFDRSLAVTGPVELTVTTVSGDITVRGGSASTVHVRGIIRAGNGFFSGNAEAKIRRLESNPPIVQQGNYIRIGHIEDAELRRGVSISYEIETPAQTQLKASSGSGDVTVGAIHGPVKASSGSGDLRISDVDDELSASTGSGDIHADSVRGEVNISTGSGDLQAMNVSGPFYLSTGSGSVTLSEASGAPGSGGKVSTGSGSIRISGVNGPLHAGTGSGDITAQGRASGDWSLNTGSGTLVVHLPADASFDLDAHTDSGRIITHRSVTIQGTFGKGTLRGTVGHGGPLVKLRTGSGDIEID